MTAYLVANPPRRSQFRKPRRAVPTGTCVLHSAENAPDLRPPDDGAEGIARFIQGRSDPGSYHVIADQDSRIQLVPFEWEAYGDGTGSNPWGIQLSLALRAKDWWTLTDQQRLWYMASLATAARDASDWLLATQGFVVPVRRLTKASANQAGFCTHQDREDWFGTPGRRTDPWRNDPAMWHLFLTLYADTAKPDPPKRQEADVVNDIRELHEVYLGAGPDPAKWSKDMRRSFDYHLERYAKGRSLDAVRGEFAATAKAAGTL